ncbi:MAG TPA: ribonuclease III [Thermoleophilia bacterium]|nr:ribonuclease III [Thermoleophilia bacterium]
MTGACSIAPDAGGSRSEPTVQGLPLLVRELPSHLLGLALTHSSWVDARTTSNERLEFLGDSVLGLAVAAHLYDRFPGEDEGDLARWKAFAVSRESCETVSRRLGFGDLVMTCAPAGADQRAEVAMAPAAMGNLLEALIGACFLAHGFPATMAAVIDAFFDQVTFAVSGHMDFKTTLQEHLAAAGSAAASYAVVGEEGPPHDRLFTTVVTVAGEALGRGRGRSIKKSEQEAAREALVALGVLPQDAPDNGVDRSRSHAGDEAADR